KFFNHHRDIGGGGAIDLVMHVENFNFMDAVSWLGVNIGKAEAIGAAMVRAKAEAVEAIKEPAPMPEPVEQNWPHVRSYLINERGLGRKLVDWLHEKNMLFADFMKNACFRYGKSGVERTGTRDGKYWKNFAGSRKDGFILRQKEPDGVIFVESAIDAASLFKAAQFTPRLAKYSNFDVIAVGGVGHEAVMKWKAKYKTIVIGFDNDHAGNTAYQRLNVSGTLERLIPEPPYKDWSGYLQGSRKEAAVEPLHLHAEHDQEAKTINRL
ncbi:MAG: toprim domain-containing protein, partial [Methylobacter sp.]